MMRTNYPAAVGIRATALSTVITVAAITAIAMLTGLSPIGSSIIAAIPVFITGLSCWTWAEGHEDAWKRKHRCRFRIVSAGGRYLLLQRLWPFWCPVCVGARYGAVTPMFDSVEEAQEFVQTEREVVFGEFTA